MKSLTVLTSILLTILSGLVIYMIQLNIDIPMFIYDFAQMCLTISIVILLLLFIFSIIKEIEK